MKTDQIRESFLNYFEKKRGHTRVASDSLVPQKDPTLLFTSAGMNQFKEYFLGLKKDLKRAASCQKCLRTGDLDEVGRTPYHHSFFEMLGNFSFGDYFKEEAIEWAWEFLTAELKIPKERLRVSVHKKDKEAFDIWRTRVREDWITSLGDKSNFWPANAPADGPNGPCGPCSEIYFDQEPQKEAGGSVEGDSERFAEIWNLVFTQYDRQEGGKLVALANKNIDTGMGLERLACVLQGKKTNYEIDIFQPINNALMRFFHFEWADEAKRKLIYAMSDHARAVVFAIADGVVPSNEKRGYVIRKLIRRALWNAKQALGPLGYPKILEEPFLYRIALPAIISTMSASYPEMKVAELSVANILKAEEERFLLTLDSGSRILGRRLSELENKKVKMVPGDIVFELYDTYGFPDDLTKVICKERGFKIDQEGFDRLMEAQRKRAKDASQISGGIFVTSDLEKKVSGLPATIFLGYHTLSAQGKVIFADFQGPKGVVVLDQTPFYAESGGQVGDQGTIETKTAMARVMDTQKKEATVLHFVEIGKGSLKKGEEATATVNRDRRDRAMRNHTATHLLHAALRKLLGSQVRQLGSRVAPEKLRFDYSYSQPLTAAQLKSIEDTVNAEILKDTAVCKEEKSTEEAKEEGAIAFFGEKYGKRVRVVTVPGFSKEFCGGTHCERTGQIGAFVIVSDASIASGTRRIEALTGEGALESMRHLRDQVQRIAESLKTPPTQLQDRIAKLQESVRRLEKERGRAAETQWDVRKILEGAAQTGSLKFVAFREKGLELAALRSLSDRVRSMSKKTVYFLASENNDNIHFLMGTSQDLSKTSLDLRELGKVLTPLLKVAGGGRADLVQGGARNEGQLERQWQKISETIVAFLKEKGP